LQGQDYKVDASKLPNQFSQFLMGRQRFGVVVEDDAFSILINSGRFFRLLGIIFPVVDIKG